MTTWDNDPAVSDEEIVEWNRAVEAGDPVIIGTLQDRLLRKIHAKIAAEDLEDQT